MLSAYSFGGSGWNRTNSPNRKGFTVPRASPTAPHFRISIIPMSNNARQYKQIRDYITRNNDGSDYGNLVCFAICITRFLTQSLGPQFP